MNPANAALHRLLLRDSRPTGSLSTPTASRKRLLLLLCSQACPKLFIGRPFVVLRELLALPPQLFLRFPQIGIYLILILVVVSKHGVYLFERQGMESVSELPAIHPLLDVRPEYRLDWNPVPSDESLAILIYANVIFKFHDSPPIH